MQLATCQNLTDTPKGSYIFGMPNDLHRAILTAVIDLDVSHEKSYAPPSALSFLLTCLCYISRRRQFI